MGTELTVQQRAAVALESSKAAAELQALAESSKGITAITNRAGREECHSAAMAATKARTGIVQAGKAARDDATRFSKAVIAEEARLVAIIQPEESRLKALRDEWDAEAAREKAAKAEAERLRVLEITQRIALMKLAASNAAHFSVSSEGAAGILSAVEEIEIDSSFAEFFGEAKETHAAAVAEIRTTVEAKRASEEAAAKAQNERILAKIAAEEAARVAEQVRKEEAAAAKAKADAEAAERAERERVEAAARKVEQDKADELRRIEAEKLAAERKALEEQRAKFEADEAAARLIWEIASKEREDRERAEQEAKYADGRVELEKIEAAKRKADHKEMLERDRIVVGQDRIIEIVENVEDLQMLADIYAAVVAITKTETKEAA
jgi:hypothetical protein